MNENIETKITETFTKENKMEEDEDSSIYDNHIEQKNNNIENIDKHVNANNYQKTLNCHDIVAILQKISSPHSIIKLIKKKHLRKEDIYNLKYFRFKKERKKRSKNEIIKDEKNNKKGRKLKSNNEKGKHTKNSPDNIVKKIKGILLTNLIAFINKLIQKHIKVLKCNFKLIKLNYKLYVNQLKKQIDSDMLKLPLKDLVSGKISGKNNNAYGDNWNKDIIDKILAKLEKDNELYILLNITFSEWINIFLFKSINISDDKITRDLLLLELTKQINKLKNEEDEEKEIYFTRFMYYLYNYQNYLNFKKGRNRNTKNSIEKKATLKK